MNKIMFLKIFVTVLGLLAPITAQGVVSRVSKTQKHMSWITTGAAARAHSDVQMRRLLNVFTAKNVDADEIYDKLQELRRNRSK